MESVYWKEELKRIAQTLRPASRPRRWSERAANIVERDISVGFFIVRKLIELYKVSSRTASMQLNVFSTPSIKNITRTNSHDLEENYNWAIEKSGTLDVSYACNQCIHSYLMFVFRDKKRNLSDLIVASDYDRNKKVWRIPVSEILRLFDVASKDYPVDIQMKHDEKINDYRVSTD